jgi:hypothetical protein
MDDYIEDEAKLTWDYSKQGWLVSILKLGAWLGTVYSDFCTEVLSRKYAILVNVANFILEVLIQITTISGLGQNSIFRRTIHDGYGRRLALDDRADV